MEYYFVLIENDYGHKRSRLVEAGYTDKAFERAQEWADGCSKQFAGNWVIIKFEKVA